MPEGPEVTVSGQLVSTGSSGVAAGVSSVTVLAALQPTDTPASEVPLLKSVTVVTTGGQIPTARESAPVAADGITIVPGESRATVAGQVISAGSKDLNVDGTTAAFAAAPRPTGAAASGSPNAPGSGVGNGAIFSLDGQTFTSTQPANSPLVIGGSQGSSSGGPAITILTVRSTPYGIFEQVLPARSSARDCAKSGFGETTPRSNLHNLNTRTISRMYQSLPTNGDGYLWVRLLALEEPLNEEEPLRCCLEPFKLHTSTSDLHKFKALSYVWGFSLYQSSIICNGEATNISSNLYDGLFAIWRRTPDAWVWADALCINQRDREETSIQVRNMDLIYSTAVQTCIWLGRLSDPEQTKQVFELSDRHHASFAKRIGPQTPFAMMTLTQGYEMTHNWVERTLGADGPRKVFDVVDQLVAHPWHTRIWTTQEFILGRDIQAYFGHSVMDWDKLWDAIEGWLPAMPVTSLVGLDNSYFHHLEATIDRAKKYRLLVQFRRAIAKKGDFTFDDVLSFSETRESGDPRDRIYGLIGIMKRKRGCSEQMIPVDYSYPIVKVFTDATRQLITMENSLEVMRKTGLVWRERARIANADSEDAKIWASLPSWARNFRDPTPLRQSKALAAVGQRIDKLWERTLAELDRQRCQLSAGTAVIRFFDSLELAASSVVLGLAKVEPGRESDAFMALDICFAETYVGTPSVE